MYFEQSQFTNSRNLLCHLVEKTNRRISTMLASLGLTSFLRFQRQPKLMSGKATCLEFTWKLEHQLVQHKWCRFIEQNEESIFQVEQYKGKRRDEHCVQENLLGCIVKTEFMNYFFSYLSHSNNRNKKTTPLRNVHIRGFSPSSTLGQTFLYSLLFSLTFPSPLL